MRNCDKHSLEIVALASLSVPFGIYAGFTHVGRIESGRMFFALAGTVLALVGVIIRQRAVHTLKQYFTLNVTILDDHRIVKRGLYKTIRHPSYTGYLLRYFGGGLAFANWLSLLLIFLPTLAAILYRMRVEEEALTETFGSEYTDYLKHTKRLIPKIY
ncbi:MAG: isoprenylcysteine carboxylmethyltransferase family protein [Pyrinomonadaceae bacterium]|nr:isoprenylcysteine carboxylmethyltransferase family protein [Pyrinomonadaceae bacterium]